ncbi:MAG TPA: thiamine pyrophosphate-requiring protein [Candidatus Binatia bacterium]|nr:thiamine pyrophosphate-requiring protein [Candidatus Binatia bacterium]
MAKITLNNVTVSDAYMALLADRGIEYWFANAGTDFAPVVETLAKAQMLETKVPKAVTCPHENTAMHMAIGYFLVTGRPQAVMVHVNVGTANGMNGLLNAARGHVPVLFTAGRTPTNEDGLAGHRSLDIHWTQEMFDQAGMLRESVKWDYELRNGQQLETVVDRALTIAKSEPMGPVYLSLPREVLSQTMAEFTYTTPSRQHAAAPAFPNGDAVEELAALLADAENPLIITSSAGRDPKAWSALADFAERYAIPVIQYRNRYMSIPSNHPMNLGYELSPLLEKADVILAVDVPVPWLPAYDKVRDDAKVIHMGPDPLHGYVPVRGHPCDIALACATAEGLRVLNETMAEHEGRAKLRIDKRRASLAESWKTLRDGWRKKLESVKAETPIHPAWITHCINEIKGDDTIVIKESPLMQEHIDFSKPTTMFNAGAASGLGHGLGCALGAKLAVRDRLVIGTHGDGSYMFGNPISAHYVGAEQELPVLTVLFNNQRWQAVRRATAGLNREGFAAKSQHQPITFLDSISNYQKAVEVADGYGEKVTDPAEVMSALERGLRAVNVEKRQAVINIICSA